MKTYAELLRNEYYRDNYIAADLVELHLKNSSGVNTPIYLTTGGFDITWASTTSPTANPVYTAQGEFMGFSPMGEDFDVRVGKFTIYLSGVGNEYVNQFVNGEFEGKRVVIYKAFLAFQTVTQFDLNFQALGTVEQLNIVSNPILMFDGTIYNVSITENQVSCQIGIDCSSLFADFERTAGRKTNNGSNWLYQGNEYDKAFEKAGFIGNQEIKWGKV
jgi:hypothetical protein